MEDRTEAFEKKKGERTRLIKRGRVKGMTEDKMKRRDMKRE
jgi:hypothetical protein